MSGQASFWVNKIYFDFVSKPFGLFLSSKSQNKIFGKKVEVS